MLDKTPSKGHSLEAGDIHVAKPPSRNTGHNRKVVNHPDVFEIILPIETTNPVINLFIGSVLQFHDQMEENNTRQEELT
jgi:hypothetical protein